MLSPEHPAIMLLTFCSSLSFSDSPKSICNEKWHFSKRNLCKGLCLQFQVWMLLRMFFYYYFFYWILQGHPPVWLRRGCLLRCYSLGRLCGQSLVRACISMQSKFRAWCIPRDLGGWSAEDPVHQRRLCIVVRCNTKNSPCSHNAASCVQNYVIYHNKTI